MSVIGKVVKEDCAELISHLIAGDSSVASDPVNAEAETLSRRFVNDVRRYESQAEVRRFGMPSTRDCESV